jgi:hypothetical protein
MSQDSPRPPLGEPSGAGIAPQGEIPSGAGRPGPGSESRNCPFYGHSLVAIGRILLANQHGNQCALLVDSYSPCRREIAGEPVEWRGCPVLRSVSAFEEDE